MAPALFTQRSTFGFAAMWYWLHSEACGAKGVRSEPVDRQPWPDSIEWFTAISQLAPAQAELFSPARHA
jgi:hypothetical protein